jgi:putative MFS transporter
MPWSALYAFMPILLSEIGAELESSLSIYLALLIQSFFCIPGTLLSTYLVTTRLGKKWTSVLGFTLTSFSVLFFLVSRSYLEVLISTCLMNFFDFIGFSSMMALVTESFPVELRSLGLGYSTAVLKFGGVISPVLIGLIFDQSNGIVLGVLLLCFFFLLISLFSSFLREPERKYSNLS